jgi:glycosyltransferase involved in cell wall biosynthesis
LSSPCPITLALATYNQAALLRRFLENYRRHGAGLVPLLIVDDGSGDGTPGLLRDAEALPQTTVHRLEHVSAAHARNHALRSCRTPWIAFSDTDCLLDGAYFETLAKVPDRFPGAHAVEGAVRSSPGPKPPFTHSLRNTAGGTYATANMVFKVADILAIGGFDEGFPANFREDTDLALTILDRLGPIPFCPDLAVEHPHLPRGFGKALRNAYATQSLLVGAEMRLYRKHPESYSRVRHHRDARGTLLAWCLKHTPARLRECLRYLLAAPGLTAAQRLRGIAPAGQELIVAFLEQACLGAVCASRYPDIARLRSR